jgi:hypothetical protein
MRLRVRPISVASCLLAASLVVVAVPVLARQPRSPAAPPRPPAPAAPGAQPPAPAPAPPAPGKRSPPPANPPFEITEDRARCSNYEPRRQALFGTTHLHTGLSFDASIRFVDYQAGNSPRGAYRFAQGKGTIQLPDPSGAQRPGAPIGGGPNRTPKIDRPIDWGAVTDHSEHFGVMGICKDPAGKDIPERLSMECRMINGFFYEPGRAVNPVLGSTLAANAFTQLTITSDGAISHSSTWRLRSTPSRARRSPSSGRRGCAARGRTRSSTRASTRSTTSACSRSRSAATARCGAARGSASIR